MKGESLLSSPLRCGVGFRVFAVRLVAGPDSPEPAAGLRDRRIEISSTTFSASRIS